DHSKSGLGLPSIVALCEYSKTQPRRQESREYPQGNQEPQVTTRLIGLSSSGKSSGSPDALPFLAQHPRGAEGGELGKIGTQFDLKPHMQFNLWPKIKKDIDRHLAKIYTDNKSALKAEHWVANPEDGTYDVEGIRSRRPANTSAADWYEQIRFWSNPKNAARCAQNAQNRAKSTVICRQRSRSLVVLRDRQGLGVNTLTGVPYTDDRPLFARESSAGTFPVLVGFWRERGKDVLVYPEPRCTHTSNVDELKRTNKQLKKLMDMIMKVVRSDDKMSQLLTQLQSPNEVGSGSGSGRGGDDESGDDEDAGEDEEDEDS
ncbi:hypothetical protein Tco_0945154, partial [Tanacetum coccineum]